MWYEKLGFEENPYRTANPYTIPLSRITWNREDLPESTKQTLWSFIDRVCEGDLVGMRIYGEFRSGKTWLLRFIEKKVLERLDDKVIIIKTKVPKLEANFSSVYRIAIKSILEEQTLFEKIKGKCGEMVDDWKKFFEDEDIATALFNIYQGEEITISQNWLFGESLTASELAAAGIHSKLTKDYLRFEKLQRIISKLSEIFSTVVMFVDELENADPSFAEKLSDTLRDLYDSFYDKFSIACSFTARRVEEWADLGYKAALAGRLHYNIRIETLKKQYVPEFLRKHHKCYRKKEVEDQLHPFTEEAISKLTEVMAPETLVPGYVIANCGRLAERAVETDNIPITASFVDENKNILTLEAM